DGSDIEPAGPPGSEIIEQVFNDAFLARGINPQPTQFSGRSDYGPFIDVGIPAGGLFTGAEGIKTEAQAAEYGGTAGEQYDSCYHTPCDTLDNVSLEALELNSKVAADVTLQFAFAELPLVPAVPALTLSSFSTSAAYDFAYLGSHLRK
ncbi:MAG: M28 family peptidase, partial [Kiloniellales bacterium]|nr:M28 family peptidase [Kiloniellales bacterium]